MACSFWGRDRSVQMLVMLIIGGCDLGEETSNHFNNIADGHVADHVLCSLHNIAVRVRQRRGQEEARIIASDILNVLQRLDGYATGRGARAS